MGHDVSAVRRYLDHVLTALTVAPSTLAQRAGISHTTLTRFLNKSDGGQLSAATIRKIEKASGIAAAPILSEVATNLTRAMHPHPRKPVTDRHGQPLGQMMTVPAGKGRTIRFGEDGRSEVFDDGMYGESDRWGTGPLACIAPIRGIVGPHGAVIPGQKPEDFPFPAVLLPFDLHDGADAWFVDTDTMLPRYGRGDILLCWGGRRLLDNTEIVEGILWIEDQLAIFGLISTENGAYSVDVLGTRPFRRIAGKNVDVLNAVVRHNRYQGCSFPI